MLPTSTTLGSMVIKLLELEYQGENVFYPKDVHGFIYSQVLDTELGKAYHESNICPFHIKNVVKKGRSVSLQVIVFNHELLMEIYRSIAEQREINIGKSRYLICDIHFHPEQHEKAELIPYSKFINEEISDKIYLNFKNTAFKQGKNSLVLPSVQHIIQSLLRKWNALSNNPFKVDNLYDFSVTLAENLVPISLKLDTAPYYISETEHFGTFSGYIVLHNKHQDYLKHICNTLLHFAHYSGVGWLTGYGMGSVNVGTYLNRKGSTHVQKLGNHV